MSPFLYLIGGVASLATGAVSLAIALRRRTIRQQNTALGALERFDGGHANAPGLLRVTRGLATPLEGTSGTPIDPTEHAVWIRYVLEELAHGWVEILSESRPARFLLSMGEGRRILVDATLPQKVLLTDSSSRVFGRTPETEFDSMFDEELPEEIQLCGEEFATRVEAERSSRDALFRVRIERILEGESVFVSGVVDATGEGLRLADKGSGTLLANVPEAQLTVRPSAFVDLALALFGLTMLASGLFCMKLWGKL